MPGRTYSALLNRATDQYGFITPTHATELGIDPQRLVVLEARGVVDRLDRGLYRFPTIPRTPLDEFMEATLWPRGLGVISHETALDLHELCDVNPAKIHITLPTQFRLRREAPRRYGFHRRDLAEDEKTLHEGVPIVTPARAILDGIEDGLRGGLVDQAIDTAQRRGLLRSDDLQRISESRGNRSAPA